MYQGKMYGGNDRTRQVNMIRCWASEIAAGYMVEIEDFGGNVGAAADEAVEYYLDELDTPMPEWFDNHDRGLLVRFTEEAL